MQRNVCVGLKSSSVCVKWWWKITFLNQWQLSENNYGKYFIWVSWLLFVMLLWCYLNKYVLLWHCNFSLHIPVSALNGRGSLSTSFMTDFSDCHYSCYTLFLFCQAQQMCSLSMRIIWSALVYFKYGKFLSWLLLVILMSDRCKLQPFSDMGYYWLH